MIEYSVLSASRSAGVGGAVTLARIMLNGSAADAVSYAETPYASSLIGPGRIGYRELEAGLRCGWVRLPFKPFPMEDNKPSGFLGLDGGRSTDEGASGVWPSPSLGGRDASATFSNWRASGKGRLKVEFFRCGLGSDENDDEKSNMLLLNTIRRAQTSPRRV